jgi:hypothetical protein
MLPGDGRFNAIFHGNIDACKIGFHPLHHNFVDRYIFLGIFLFIYMIYLIVEERLRAALQEKEYNPTAELSES